MNETTRNRLSEISARANAIYEAAESEDRDLTADQANELDALIKEATDLKRKAGVEELSNLTARRVSPERPRNPNTPTEHYQPEHISAGVGGSRVQILNRGDSLVQRLGGQSDLTLGGFLKAAVLGGEKGRYLNTLQEGTDSAGGYLVPEVLVAQLIDRLRAKSVLMQAGATTMMLPSGGEVSMPTLTGDPTAAWHRESASISASDPTFGRVTFQPRTLTALVKVSRELLSDGVGTEEALLNAFAQSMALEVDRAGLLGDGTGGEPLGVAGSSGIGNVLMGANGLALSDYSPFVNVSYQLTQDNANMPTAFILNPRTYTEAANLLDSQNQPMQKPEAIANIPMLQTTQVPINDTQGSATDASKVYAGDWAELIWGVRQELQIEVLKELYAANYEIGFLASLRGDYVVRHAESFATITGIIPA